MTAVAGHLLLALALATALIQAVFPALGLWRRNTAWMTVAAPAAMAQCLTVVVAFGLLTLAFIGNDFSIAYVANNSNSLLPTGYRIAAVWGGHEGSLLLWLLMLNGWTLAVVIGARRLPVSVQSTVVAVLGAVAVGFLLFMLLTSNPFERVFPVPGEGRDLNPLLQDPGLAIHPPMLYMGYVGFAVAFAFAITALLHGRMDTAWVRWTRPWTTASWLFLTIGIALGSWWAYSELGWGGWWFWDPVENASFMPWLVGTALIHTLAVTEKRNLLHGWTLLLAICAFSLSLLGTFLVRSGVLVSVHAFATDPSRGVFILAFFGVVVGGSLLLYMLRAHKLVQPGSLQLFTREGLLLLNNVFLVVAALTVLLGTLYPLIVDAMGLPKPSVGPPWFNLTFVPITVPLLALVGLAYSVNWRRGSWSRVVQMGGLPLLAALVIGITLPLLTIDLRGIGSYPACVLGAWAITTSMAELLRWLRRGSRPTRSVVGMCLAHTGLGVFAIGVTLVSNADVERDVVLAPGQTTTVAGYTMEFVGERDVVGPNYTAQRGTLRVMDTDGDQVATLFPEKRAYVSQPNNPMAEASVHATPLRDLYAAMGEAQGDGYWSLRLYYKPFVRWIWLGALIMAIGGGVAVSDPRYRVASRVSAPAGAATAGARA